MKEVVFILRAKLVSRLSLGHLFGGDSGDFSFIHKLSFRRPGKNFLCDNWQETEHNECAEKLWADDSGGSTFGECLQVRHAGSGIYLSRGASEHSELTDPPECRHLDRSQSHHHIDDEERHDRNQS